MADSRRYNEYDRRPSGGQAPQQSAGQAGYRSTYGAGSQPRREGGYDSVERYPSGRPKTQRQYPDGSQAPAAGRYSSQASQQGYAQGYGRGSGAADYSHEYAQNMPSYRRGAAYSYQDAQGAETGARGSYTSDDRSSYQGQASYGRTSAARDDGYARESGQRFEHVQAGTRPLREQGSSHSARGSHAAAPTSSLPAPLARLTDTAHDNPVLVGAIALGVVIVIVALVIAACSAGGRDGSYVQAVDNAKAGADATVSAVPSATPVTTQATSQVADATADATNTTADATATDAGTTDAAAQTQEQSAVAQQLTPAWPDDVSSITDIFTFATTSFDKDATYNNGGVEDPWSPTGYFTTGDAELDQMVKDYCDSNTNDGLDAGDNAYYTFLHISWIDYVESDRNQRPWDLPGDWRITYAKQCFSTMSANCHEFAAAVQYILRYFGYSDACAETCLVLRQSGNWGDHSLVFVTSLDGRQSIIDTSLSSKGWLLSKDSMSYTLDSGYRADLANEDSGEGEQAAEGEQAGEGEQAADNG